MVAQTRAAGIAVKVQEEDQALLTVRRVSSAQVLLAAGRQEEQDDERRRHKELVDLTTSTGTAHAQLVVDALLNQRVETASTNNVQREQSFDALFAEIMQRVQASMTTTVSASGVIRVALNRAGTAANAYARLGGHSLMRQAAAELGYSVQPCITTPNTYFVKSPQSAAVAGAALQTLTPAPTATGASASFSGGDGVTLHLGGAQEFANMIERAFYIAARRGSSPEVMTFLAVTVTTLDSIMVASPHTRRVLETGRQLFFAGQVVSSEEEPAPNNSSIRFNL